MLYTSIKSVAEKIKNGEIFSWLYKDKNKIKGIIISPDTDGFVSALFLNKVFDWKVVGFYDGKILVITENVDFENEKEKYVFIDIEILRSNIKSTGHHILLYNSQQPHPLITSIKDVCLQPNNWRGMDVERTFAQKYPFGTFHLLLSIIYFLDPQNPAFKFNPEKALVPSIYLDGVFKNLFNYPENCLDWLKYMSNDDPNHPFEKLLNHPTTPKDLMKLMKQFFHLLNKIWTTQNKRRKGKITLDRDISNEYLDNKVQQELVEYLEFLAQQYNYRFNPSLWTVITSKLKIFKLKKSIAPGTKTKYIEVLNKNPVSLAITSKARDGLEYTEDTQQIF
ncbi:MAG: hypothetical protein QXD43_04360 [Candidatus Aenigmatarchaeota archaeon]